jgi:uncharacterized protein (TIGR03083 family)
MDSSTLLAIFDAEHDALLEACARAGVAAPVPSCPEWKVGDLLYHLYEVQYLWNRITSERRDGFEGMKMPMRPADEHLIDLVRGEHAGYTAMLRSFPASTPIATWTGPQTLAWLFRRMAQETAVHRVDAQRAAGEVGAIDAELASDGIDEFLEFFLNTREGAVVGSVHIHCTDVAGEWTVRPVDGADESGFDVTREHAKGDAAIRGTANDILLALWRRGPLSACDVVGDVDVAAHFVAASSLA